MTPKPECVSDMLRDLQRNMNQVILEHGSIHLDRNASAKLVVRLGEMAEFARQLENAWSQAEWNRRAVSDRMELIASMTRVSAEILGLMRPDAPTEGKVLPFRRPSPETNPGPSAPPGGNAA